MTKRNYTFDSSLKKIEDALLALISRIGPFFVALIPASFTAVSVYSIFHADDPRLAWYLALVTAIGIEVSGIKIIHTAVDMYRARSGWKAFIMTVSSLAYAVIVAAIVYNADDALEPIIRGLGIGSPFLALMVYLAVAFSREVEHVEVIEAETVSDDKTFEREMKRRKLELKHEETMAHISVSSVSKSVSPGTPVTHLDDTPFDTATQALLDWPDATVAQIVNQTGVSRSTVNRAKKQLNGHRNEVTG